MNTQTQMDTGICVISVLEVIVRLILRPKHPFEVLEVQKRKGYLLTIWFMKN